MRFVSLRPGSAARALGGVGPLQGEGAAGSLAWTIAPTPIGSELVQTCVVGGHLRPEAKKLAPLADGVLSTAANRLKAYVETGTAPTAETR